MNSRMRHATIVVTTSFALAAISSFAQDAPKASGRSDFESLREKARPGPEHEGLARHVGNWKVKVGMGNGDGARTSNGRAKCHMMMDGRFLWIAYNVAGEAGALKGAFMIGFDRRNARYTLTGIDTYGTYSIASQGTKDAKTGRIKLYGKDDDPHMKAMGFEKEFAHELDFRKIDEFTIDVYFIDTRTPQRREMKAMEFYFSRNK